MIHIAFTATPTLFGRLIRWFTRSKVSHAYIKYYSEQWNEWWALESTAQGVRLVPAKKLEKYTVAEYKCLFNGKPALQKVAKYVGQYYDIAGIFVFAWAIILKEVFKRRLRKPLNNTSGQMCSEIVARFYQYAELDDVDIWDPELIDPDELLDYARIYPKKFKVIKDVM